MAGLRSGRSRRGLISGLIIGAVALGSVGLNTGISSPPRYDGAGYAVLGLALSTGQGYREIHTPGRERHTHYPPGYPLALGGLWRLTGRSAQAAHLFSVACTFGAILAGWRWFGSMYRPGIALAAGLALAVNWTWGRVGGAIFSEPMYLLLGQLAILATLWAARRGGVGRGLILGLLIGACVLTRHVGVTLAAAIGLELLLRGRRSMALLAGASASLVVLPWVAWLAASRRPTQVGLIAGEPLPGLVARQFLFYVRRIPDQWIAPVVEIGTVFANSAPLYFLVNAWAFAATGLIAWGWCRAFPSPRRRLASLVPLTTFPLLLVWPFTEAGRFLIPLVPCLIVGAIEGLTPIAAMLRLERPRAWAAWAVLAASIPYPAYALMTGRAEAQRRADRGFDAACDWIARHGDRNGPILTTHAAEVFWATGRVGLAPDSDDPEDVARSIERLGAAYLIVDENRYARAPASPLERYVREHPGRFRRVWGRDSDGMTIAIEEVLPVTLGPALVE
ncbi:ArnT family glycosyltransferase [Tundrisphaera lichenicola]|uniref:ArnT family glycosyltransferase n=1 Tax=Tundrisphaera lichenicola TaxID=2029860 RepID=UPI003EBDE8F7